LRHSQIADEIIANKYINSNINIENIWSPMLKINTLDYKLE